MPDDLFDVFPDRFTLGEEASRALPIPAANVPAPTGRDLAQTEPLMQFMSQLGSGAPDEDEQKKAKRQRILSVIGDALLVMASRDPARTAAQLIERRRAREERTEVRKQEKEQRSLDRLFTLTRDQIQEVNARERMDIKFSQDLKAAEHNFQNNAALRMWQTRMQLLDSQADRALREELSNEDFRLRRANMVQRVQRDLQETAGIFEPVTLNSLSQKLVDQALGRKVTFTDQEIGAMEFGFARQQAADKFAELAGLMNVLTNIRVETGEVDKFTGKPITRQLPITQVMANPVGMQLMGYMTQMGAAPEQMWEQLKQGMPGFGADTDLRNFNAEAIKGSVESRVRELADSGLSMDQVKEKLSQEIGARANQWRQLEPAKLSKAQEALDALDLDLQEIVGPDVEGFDLTSFLVDRAPQFFEALTSELGKDLPETASDIVGGFAAFQEFSDKNLARTLGLLTGEDE